MGLRQARIAYGMKLLSMLFGYQAYAELLCSSSHLTNVWTQGMPSLQHYYQVQIRLTHTQKRISLTRKPLLP